MSIRAVFLDVDDTLVDYGTAAREAFYAAVGDEGDYERFLGFDHYERFLTGELDFQSFRDQRMAAYLAAVGRDGDVARAREIEQQRYAGLAHGYRLFDDALPLLTELRARGLSIGLITNNESTHQREKLRIVGLDTLVDVIVISEEVRAAKPDARIFANACALLGAPAAEAVHVGDNFYADAQGAHDAGLRAVWLDRRGEHDGAALDFPVVSGLASVPALLD
jgi:putative hydrolase of the HAD superfamily